MTIHSNEPHGASHNARLNSLRAGVLGANDGIVSVAALLLGVVGSGASASAILTAGLAATVSGAASMALGEYVSVSAQRDSERMMITKETRELEELPEQEHEELVTMLSSYGMGWTTADTAAREIAAEDRLLEAHLRLEIGIDGEDLTNPWHAAFWSAVSFLAGACLPLLSIFLAPEATAPFTVAIVTLIALAVTGYVSARLAGTDTTRSVLRLVIGGALGLAITYGIGVAFGGVVG
ncbi:VIT family protein [Corynebacterium sp. FDAARGOS 1242]|uniref:VIT1/CCC1 transporter family protein n=1 Tax=Corynebacterium sp. FDAARGOS 1242 TaxID=2778078 RepID=UPI00194FC5C3|nr:VIT family protein [Corynebacterium sp. FDAARGOS 1242]QRP98637.1 VIT family protein [Corynebacterium sp. FDAARGOS 1242]